MDTQHIYVGKDMNVQQPGQQTFLFLSLGSSKNDISYVIQVAIFSELYLRIYRVLR